MPGGGHFVGEFNEHFLPHGDGAHFAADGSELASGQWRDGKQHGRGKFVFPGGDRYEGDFVDDDMSGLGTLTWANGSVYEGEWADNKRSGLGVMWGKEGGVAHCGRWVGGQLAESRPVPRSTIPLGSRLSPHGPTRSAAAAARSAAAPSPNRRVCAPPFI
jgi:hypothetical protein